MHALPLLCCVDLTLDLEQPPSIEDGMTEEQHRLARSTWTIFDTSTGHSRTYNPYGLVMTEECMVDVYRKKRPRPMRGLVSTKHIPFSKGGDWICRIETDVVYVSFDKQKLQDSHARHAERYGLWGEQTVLNAEGGARTAYFYGIVKEECIGNLANSATFWYDDTKSQRAVNAKISYTELNATLVFQGHEIWAIGWGIENTREILPGEAILVNYSFDEVPRQNEAGVIVID